GGAPLTPSEEDLALLADYAWPGNVRQLAAVIERAAILGNGKRLDVRGALGATVRPLARPPRQAKAATAPGRALATIADAMAAHTRRHLEACHGRIEGPFDAARLLDTNPHTLRARMRKLGAQWSRSRLADSR